MHLCHMFSRWLRLRIRERKWKRAFRTTRRQRSETFLRFPDCFQRHRSIASRIFQCECFWSITNLPIPYPHSPAVFFFWRDRRDVNDSAAKRGTVLVEEVGGGETNEELAFSGNFPVAPCANIYREYRDLCELLICMCAIAMQHSHAQRMCTRRAIAATRRGCSMHRGAVWIHA